MLNHEKQEYAKAQKIKLSMSPYTIPKAGLNYFEDPDFMQGYMSPQGSTASMSEYTEFVNYGLQPELIIQHSTPEARYMQRLIRDYVAEQFKQRKQSLKFEFPNERVTDFLQIVDEWWNEVDVKKAKEISMRDFCRLIINKGVVSKAFEVIKMIKSTIRIKISADGFIKHSQFQQIFVRVYMRAVLMNIYYYLRKMTERDNEDDKMELAKKINGSEIGSEIKNGLLYVLKYQRKLVFGGIRLQDKNLGVDR